MYFSFLCWALAGVGSGLAQGACVKWFVLRQRRGKRTHVKAKTKNLLTEPEPASVLAQSSQMSLCWSHWASYAVPTTSGPGCQWPGYRLAFPGPVHTPTARPAEWCPLCPAHTPTARPAEWCPLCPPQHPWVTYRPSATGGINMEKSQNLGHRHSPDGAAHGESWAG